ncbi:MAG: hypothetical protein EBV40_01975 [Actinobacteria bacterium]|nr:hypothetical protein [Actinomycetota bacterium]
MGVEVFKKNRRTNLCACRVVCTVDYRQRSVSENLVHGSDSAASASRELEIFFPGLAKKTS